MRPIQARHGGEFTPSPARTVGPDARCRTFHREQVGRGGPESAALPSGILDLPKQATDLLFAWSSRHHPEDLVGRGVGTIDEVADVGAELCPKASRLLGAAVPLQVKKELAVRGKEPAPAIRNRAVLVGFGVGGDDLVLAYPVIKANVLRVARGDHEADEELVGLQLVNQVEASFQRMFGPLDELFRTLVAPLSQPRRPPPSEQVDGGTADPARPSGRPPAYEQAVLEEPLQPVLAVSWSGKEEGLNLVTVEVAMRVQLLQDGVISEGEFRVMSYAVGLIAMELEDSKGSGASERRQSRGEIGSF